MLAYQKKSKVGVTSCGIDTMLGATTTPNINVKRWHQRQGDWEHSTILSIIQCKKLEHIATKELAKLHSHMVLITQKWDKIIDAL